MLNDGGAIERSRIETGIRVGMGGGGPGGEEQPGRTGRTGMEGRNEEHQWPVDDQVEARRQPGKKL